MARKKIRLKNNKTRPSFSFLKNGVIFLFIFFVAFIAGERIIWGLKNADYFRIKRIIYPSSITLRDTKVLSSLKNKSIFSVNLSFLQKKLENANPSVAKLLLLRRFPDTIVIVAKERRPVMQIQTKRFFLTLDKEGYIVNASRQSQPDLPIVKGSSFRTYSLTLGKQVRGVSLDTAERIIRAFEENPRLKRYRIEEINVSNLAKIILHLDKGPPIFIDQEKITSSLNNLAILLSTGELHLNSIRYIDLRFKEPVIGKVK